MHSAPSAPVSSRPNLATTPVSSPAETITRDKDYYRKESRIWLGLGLAGIIAGLSAPGPDLAPLAWFAITPLLIATLTSRTVPEAFYRGVHFGFGYTLVYNICALEFTTDVWPETMSAYISLANPIIWFLVGLQQSALFGTFCSIVRWMPLSDGFVPRMRNGGWQIPALFAIPLVWCLIFNKLGNAWGSLGLTWGLLEYTQYNWKSLIQIAGIVGGVGIGALIMMCNTALTSLILNVARFPRARYNYVPRSCLLGLLLVLALIAGAVGYGNYRLATADKLAAANPHEMVSILQGNILFDAKAFKPGEFFNKYLKLAENAPAGLCIWPEWAIPSSMSQSRQVFESMGHYCKKLDQDWVVGCLDGDTQTGIYNSACGIDREGKIYPEVYHKRYLVPFGEYSPAWLLNSPFGALCGTLTPHRVGYKPGNRQTVLELSGRKIAPILCCELAAPELTTEAVRNGAELLVDCSNTSWFDSKIIGKQCIAITSIRAVETHRCFVFSTTLGPSAIIDAEGRVKTETALNTANTVSANIPFYNDVTPFARWFR